MASMTSAEFAALMQRPPEPKIDTGEAADVQLSKTELDEWLDLFGGQK